MNLCACCGRTLAAHRATDGSWVGCTPLSPMNVTLPSGDVVTVATAKDVYRLAAKLKKAA